MKKVFWFVFVLAVLGWGACALAETQYYLSSSDGNDAKDGSMRSPWKSLMKISSVALQPGDTVFFKKGDRFDGHFVVNGSGTEAKPILLTSYGSGSKPVITGEVGAKRGGDFQEAIHVLNHDNLVFDGLEVNNERKVSREGVNDVDAYGIHIQNSGTTPMMNFVLRNMTVQNVFAVQPMNNQDDFDKLEVAGIRFSTAKNTRAGSEKNIQDVLIEKCWFENIQRLGIHVKHGGANEGIGNDSINRNMNIVCRDNEFHSLGGTCFLPIRTYNCLVENNLFDHPGASTDPRMPGRGSSVWTWNCINTVIQYNQCLSTRGYFDSHGIHIDHANVNTFIQYNYMEDCEGGFVEILGGNSNAVYRFNVSVNDGWRDHPTWKTSNHTLWINNVGAGKKIHLSDHSYIYNNTVCVDREFSTGIAVNAKNTFIYNNIFYSANGGNIGGKQMVVRNNGTPLYMRNNLFQGNVSDMFRQMDADPKVGNPKFHGKGKAGNRYQLKAGSPAINGGVAMRGPALPGAGTGIFKNVPPYPTVDFYGNPVDLSAGTPNIGACNAKNGEVVSD
jgi:hypothetical protein